MITDGIGTPTAGRLEWKGTDLRFWVTGSGLAEAPSSSALLLSPLAQLTGNFSSY